jgi:DNA polymerase-3 subunit epsilon
MKGLTEGCGCFPTGRHYAGIAHLIRAKATGIVEGFDSEAPWIDLPIALIDVETTGRDPGADRIVEIAIVVGRSGQIVTRASWLVNPGRPIPEEARAVHGITDEMVSAEPPFSAVAKDIAMALADVVPGAYNASFDRGFVMTELGLAGLEGDGIPASLAPNVEWIDPLVWARELYKFQKGKALGDMTTRLGITHESAHRATDDAEAALLVMYALAKDVRVPKGYAALTQEQRRLARAQEEERARWRSRRTDKPAE